MYVTTNLLNIKPRAVGKGVKLGDPDRSSCASASTVSFSSSPPSPSSDTKRLILSFSLRNSSETSSARGPCSVSSSYILAKIIIFKHSYNLVAFPNNCFHKSVIYMLKTMPGMDHIFSFYITYNIVSYFGILFREWYDTLFLCMCA